MSMMKGSMPLRGILTGLVLVVGLWFSAGVATADTLDQQQTESPESIAALVGGTVVPESSAQTFTAGLTGGLDRVELVLWGEGGPINVEITTVNEHGAPTGVVLASGTIPAASVPTPSSGPAWVPVSFAVPAPVVAGTQYAIVAYTAEGVYFAWGVSEDVYPGGALWFSGSSPPTTPWVQLNFPQDLAFKTYVTPASAFPLFAPGSARPDGSIPYAAKTVTLETVSKHKIRCLSREGSFQVESEHSLRLSLYLYSCTSQRQPCYTSAPGLGTQPQGQMSLGFLGQLVSLSREKHTVALLFSPYNGAVGRYEEFQVTCRDIATYFIGGQVLAPIRPVNKLIYPPATFSLKFAQKAGVQNPGLYQGSGPITLTTSLTPQGHEELVEAPEQTGFAFSSPLTFSEPLEIDG